MSRSLLCCCLFIMLAPCCNVALGGTFDLEEIQVAASPMEGRYLEFKGAEKVLDFDVAKDVPKAGSNEKRIAAYRWKGIGFSGIHDPEVISSCRDFFQ